MTLYANILFYRGKPWSNFVENVKKGGSEQEAWLSWRLVHHPESAIPPLPGFTEINVILSFGF